MRTADECLAKVDEMEGQARACAAPDLAADFLAIAQSWRQMAQMARSQDESPDQA